MSDTPAIKPGDRIHFFKLPNPKRPTRWQNWHNGVVVYVSECGRYVTLDADVSWGKRHRLKVHIDELMEHALL